MGGNGRAAARLWGEGAVPGASGGGLQANPLSVSPAVYRSAPGPSSPGAASARFPPLAPPQAACPAGAGVRVCEGGRRRRRAAGCGARGCRCPLPRRVGSSAPGGFEQLLLSFSPAGSGKGRIGSERPREAALEEQAAASESLKRRRRRRTTRRSRSWSSPLHSDVALKVARRLAEGS